MKSLRCLAITATVLSLLSTSGCSSSCPTPTTQAKAACSKGRSFIVVRHAEKASSDKDTTLSERGHARANQIATMFSNAGVTRIVATQYKRTQETVAPLAQRVSVPMEVKDASATKNLIAELNAAADGSVIVVATHSNVVPEIAAGLTHGKKLRGVTGDALPDDEFSRVVVITESCGSQEPSIVELSSDVAATTTSATP